jgi:hypothetical protein
VLLILSVTLESESDSEFESVRVMVCGILRDSVAQTVGVQL